jgi:hypothetical protein
MSNRRVLCNRNGWQIAARAFGSREATSDEDTAVVVEE